jgi:hypothetical protein
VTISDWAIACFVLGSVVAIVVHHEAREDERRERELRRGFRKWWRP